jgi:hypothetical protein
MESVRSVAYSVATVFTHKMKIRNWCPRCSGLAWWLVCLGWSQDQPAFSGDAADSSALASPRLTEPSGASVQINSFEGLAAGGPVLVRWETGPERGVLLYQLLRQNGGQWRLVSAEPLIAKGQLAGGQYQVLDRGASLGGSNCYRLEAITLDGRPQAVATRLLSVSGGASAAQLAEPASRSLADFGGATDPDAASECEPCRHAALASATPVVLPGSRTRVKLITTVPGMHFVSTATLATVLSQTAAQVQSWIDDGTITLSNQGLPVNFVPGPGRSGSATLGPGLYFYAERHVDNHTSRNVYWLESGCNTYATVSGGSPNSVAPGPFTAEMDVESDRDPWLIDNPQDPELDCWFLENSCLSAGTSSSAYSSTFSVDHLVRTPGTVGTLRVRLQGTSLSDHSVEVRLNGNLLGTCNWFGIAPVEAQFTVEATSPAVLIESAAGSNTLLLRAVLRPNVPVSQVRVDGYGLVYRRTYAANAASATLSPAALEAAAEVNPTVTVSNFGADAAEPVLLAFDTTNVRELKRIDGLRIDVSADNGTWQASFIPPPGSPTMRFALIKPAVNNSARGLTAASLSVVYPADLSAPTNAASYLAIVPPDLFASAAQLVAYRAKEFRARVVVVDDIYHEFSHGLVTPYAIAAFLRTAYARWAIPPRYVVLVGDGTWDYRNRYGFANNLLPPLMVHTAYGLASSDSRFGDVHRDGIPRVIVGRLPIKTAAQFTSVFDKITRYESELVTGLKALLIADTPAAAGDFVASLDEVVRFLQPGFTSQRVLPPPSAAARSEIRTALDAGVDVVNYQGHGALDRLGPGLDYFVKVVQTPPGLDPPIANGARLPILVAVTCEAGDFSSPSLTSVAEGYLRQPAAGAVAAIAPSGMSLHADATLLNRRLMEIFARNTSSRLGDAFLQSASLYLDGGRRATPVWIYNLIGDPALKLTTVSPSRIARTARPVIDRHPELEPIAVNR